MRVRHLDNFLISRNFDLVFILLPPIIVSLILLGLFYSGSEYSLSPIGWLVVVVGIDVAHVYATLFRTYLDPKMREERLPLLILAPIGSWFLGIALYSYSSLIFWRVLAYMAVYHFIRQQYGFFRLYEKKEGVSKFGGKLAIYSVTLYPIIYWHLNLPRKFAWFVEGDFMGIGKYLGEYTQIFASLCFVIFFVIQLFYVGGELLCLRRRHHFSVAKNLLYLGTFLCWYGGIVLCNGDLTFTLTNVICHGVPYIALVWGYNAKKNAKWKYSGSKALIYIVILLALAYFEEGLWDFFVWNEHKEFYLGIASPILNKKILAIIVPLFTIPQMTHYFLDAVIWRISKPQDSLEVLST